MKNFITGILIGSGAILPGISSGVFCVAFGIYEKLVDSILNFFKDIKGNTKFLFPILFGAFVGILIFSNILKFVFVNFNIPTSFAFMGLILGSLPLVIKKSEITEISISHIMCLIVTLSLSIYLATLEHFSNMCSASFSLRLLTFYSGL